MADVSSLPSSVASAGDLVKIQGRGFAGSCEYALEKMTLESGSLTGIKKQQKMEGVEGGQANKDAKKVQGLCRNQWIIKRSWLKL